MTGNTRAKRFGGVALLVALAITAQLPLGAQNADAVRARYTKHEYLIPMRDGVRLFTVVYTPKDTSQPYPFLLTRTPYSVAPYGVDNYRASLGPSEHFEKEGFAKWLGALRVFMDDATPPA